MKQKVTITLTEKILKHIDSIIDLAYIRNRSQAVEYLIERNFGKNKTAVILATGPSESLRLNSNEFRPTARISNTRAIEHTVKNLWEDGFKRIFIVGEQPVLTSIFSIIGDGKRYGINISYTEDANPPGTGESLRLLKGELNSTFLVLFGDVIFNKIDLSRIWKQHFKNRGIVTIMASDSSLVRGGTTIPVNKSSINIEGDHVVKIFPKQSHFSKTKCSQFVSNSLFVAEPEIFSYTGNWIENDIFPTLAEKQLMYSYISSEGEFHVHSKEDIKFAKIAIAPKIEKNEYED